MAIRLNVSLHAFDRLLEREIGIEEIESVIEEGVVIAELPRRRPFPAQLFLGFPAGRALHVVAAWDARDEEWRVVTAYWPNPDLWDTDFRTRRRR